MCLYMQPDVFAIYLYEAVSIFMTLADEIIRDGGSYNDGQQYFNYSRSLKFTGWCAISTWIFFLKAGNRNPFDFSVRSKNYYYDQFLLIRSTRVLTRLDPTQLHPNGRRVAMVQSTG